MIGLGISVVLLIVAIADAPLASTFFKQEPTRQSRKSDENGSNPVQGSCTTLCPGQLARRISRVLPGNILGYIGNIAATSFFIGSTISTRSGRRA